jgi:hypothetical protein
MNSTSFPRASAARRRNWHESRPAACGYKRSPTATARELPVALDRLIRPLIGVLWPFESGGEKELVRFGEDGSSIQVAAIGEPAETAFAQKTAMLVTSDLRLISAVDGTLQGSLSDLGRAVSQ